MKPQTRWEWLARLWRPRARQQHERDRAETRRYLAFQEQLRTEGYMPIAGFGGVLAPHDRPIEAIRFDWPASRLIRLADQAPEFNIAGLYWRDV